MDFSLVNTLNLLTFAWLGYWVFRAFKDLVKALLYHIHSNFNSLPLFRSSLAPRRIISPARFYYLS